jgi:hypothetical protein
MIGAGPLLMLRMNGQKPSGYVSIDLDRKTLSAKDWPQWQPAFPQVEIQPSEVIALLDLRFVVGLHVVLFADAWSARFAELIERVKESRPKHLVAHTFVLEEPIVWPQ